MISLPAPPGRRTSAPSAVGASPCTSCASGFALIIALLLLSIVSVLALGLSLVVSMDPMAAANQREGMAAAYIARAGMELAAHELAAAAAWDPLLSGAVTSTHVDGAPGGARTLPSGERIDLAQLTSQLTCGRAAGCSDAQMNASSAARPWGANNPRWQPFIYGTADRLGLGSGTAHYVVAWVGDDGAERDGKPEEDGTAQEGGGSVRVVVQAFGPMRGRQTIQAHVSRRCETVDGVRTCAPGIRVHNWQLAGGSVP